MKRKTVSGPGPGSGPGADASGAKASGAGAGTLSAGARHLRAEWGRWWRTEDLTDTHIAHRILNDQYRMWRQIRQRAAAEVQQNIGLLKSQQKQATAMQMQRMAWQRQQRARGGYGGYGGFGYGGGGGASPMISYRMMQWAQLQMRMNSQEFRHLEVTDSMLAIGRGQVRSRRHLKAVGWLLGLLAVWAGVWWVSAPAALLLTLLAGVFALAVVWVQGKRPTTRRPAVPKLLFVPAVPPAHTELEAPPEAGPFPIREAGRDPRRARDAVALALRKERAQVADVAVPTETAWGWSVPVVLSGGTLGDLIRILPRMATTLRVGDNRLLAQRTDAEDGAAVTLRVLTSDPFAAPPPAPARAPLSCSITDPVSIGTSIDGEPTPVVLAGQHALIVSDTGGGKSTMVRTMADYVTACTDAVAVDIDPTGRGLGPLGPCAAHRALNPADAETLLEHLLSEAEARIAALGPTEDNWMVTPERPAIVAFVEEWPRLTKRGKQLALALLRIGRKARVTLVICTQDATSDVLGDAVADTFGVRIMLPCRQADVPLVVGQADAVSRGWLPHLLVASPGEWEIADAGRFYCITPRHREAVLRYVTPIPAAAAAVRASERVAAGLPSLGTPGALRTKARDVPEIVKLLLEAFAQAGDPEALTVAQLAERLVAADPATWGQWEARTDRLAMIGRALKAHLKAADLEVPTVRLDDIAGRPTAYLLADINDALS
jgi:S-DNA-T family DNA segregation ATPase FtsK/SpoIIIE